MPLPYALVQGFANQIDPNTGRLKVEVEDRVPRMLAPNPLQIPPDTIAPNQLSFTPVRADLPSLSMPAQEAMSQKMGGYPVFNPGFGTRLVSSLAAGSAGYQQGPMAGLQTGQAYVRAPYQEKVEKFQSEAAPLMYRAGIESDNYKRALERAKIQSELGATNIKGVIDTANANSRMTQEETRRYNAQTAAAQSNNRLFGLTQPDYVFRETAGRPGVPNEIVGFSKKDREVYKTGIAGQGKWRDIEDLKGLIKYRYQELGRMLRDIPQRDVFGALDNALRNEGLRNPAIYGKFFDKNGNILSPSELQKFSGDDLETIRKLFDAAIVKSKEALTKSKDLKKGVLRPDQTIKLPDGSIILNPYDDDKVPSENDEEEQ